MDNYSEDKQKIPNIICITKDHIDTTPIKQQKETIHYPIIQPQTLILVDTPYKPQTSMFMKLLSQQKPQSIEENENNSLVKEHSMIQQPSQEIREQSIPPTTIKKKKYNTFISPLKPQKQKKFQPQLRTGCNCIQTNCLKNYCNCFKSKSICNEQCGCIGCSNRDKKIHQQSRRQKQSTKIIIFCNCRRSQCTKKYCECYSAKKKCSQQCNCIECKNIYESGSNKKTYKREIQEERPTTKKKKYYMESNE